MGVSSPLDRFAEDVGADDPVTCAGGRTQWEVGGPLQAGTREVRAPTGIVSHEPAEMIVRVRAGTTLAQLQAELATRGQQVTVDCADPARATIGGLMAVGQGGLRRLGWGPARDCVLEVTAVSARGELVRSGAPLVKNVTGFDLCRLLVGSLGTLALIAEVVLRCRPIPEAEQWWLGEVSDPLGLASRLYQPLAVLWDGRRAWVGLAGYRSDLAQQAADLLGPGFSPVEGPPAPPLTARRSVAPAVVPTLPRVLGGAQWLAEVGVGLVHCDGEAAEALQPPGLSAPVARLHREIKSRFDPGGRLNPGRSLIGAVA
jgi:glycolate oxidase FAD binding subunit